MNVDLKHLQIQRVKLEAANLAPKTLIAYRDGWTHFSAWCDRAAVAALPCTSDTLSLYAVSMIDYGCAVNSAQLRITAVAEKHKRLGLASPLGASVRHALTGARRAAQAKTSGKAALTVDQLRRMLAEPDAGMHGLRNRALLLLGFACGMRRVEIAALDLRDVSFETQGVRITITHSKTDQEWIGRDVGIAPGQHRDLCPVLALRAWLAKRGDGPGPLFPQIQTGGNMTALRLGGPSVNLIVKAYVRRIGLDPSHYGGHSLRAGCVTAAVQAGASVLSIMQRTGHKSVQTVHRYVRPASAFDCNPLANVL